MCVSKSLTAQLKIFITPDINRIRLGLSQIFRILRITRGCNLVVTHKYIKNEVEQ